MSLALLGGLSKGLGQLGSAATDIIGGDMSAEALKRAQAQAKGDINGAYGTATGFQQPIYDTALKGYQDLAGGVGAGKYANPHMGPFKFDPQSVFQDPEYQAQMRAGTDAINGGANAKSMLFSGQNQRDLGQFGSDLFANRSDALYNRGFNAQNTAFNQNNTTNQNNFSQQQALMNPLAGSAGQLTNLASMHGDDLANLDLGSGTIRANNINNTAGALGGFLNQQGSNATDLFNMLGKGK